MKFIPVALSAALLALVPTLSFAVDANDAPAPQIEAEADTSVDTTPFPADKGEKWPFSYTMGYTLGLRLLGDIPEVDRAAFQEGMQGALSGAAAQLTEGQMRRAIQEFNEGREAAAKAAYEKLAADNLKQSRDFLAANAKRKGVKVTKSGLQYEIIKKGSGASPKSTDEVTAHYVGTLPDGTVFDSSRERDEPEKFPLSRVIPGWVEGIQLMKKGAQYKFFIPPELAYGERGAGPNGPIGPNQALVFDVELLEFVGGTDDGGLLQGTDPSATQSLQR